MPAARYEVLFDFALQPNESGAMRRGYPSTVGTLLVRSSHNIISLSADALLTAPNFLLLKPARTFPLGYHGNAEGVLEGKRFFSLLFFSSRGKGTGYAFKYIGRSYCLYF